VTNHKSVENTKNPTTACEGDLRVSSATVAVAAADDDGSKYFMLPIFSTWSIKHIWLYNDAITAGTVYDVGLYSSAETPAAVSAEAYASDVDLSSARTSSPIDVAFEARDIVKVNQKVWEDAGLTADPNVWYYLTLVGATVGTAAGDITVIVEYTV
jgi:hypothetical protein